MDEENENKPEEQQEEGQENEEQQENDGGNDNTSEQKEGENDKKKKKKKPKKPHRGPPSPTPEQLRELEQGFILDNIAVNSISKDYSNVQPKLGPAIPPYNSQNDKHVDQYFKFEQVEKTLKKTGQIEGSSIDGPVIDRFIDSGAGYRYLSRRNAAGAGHSTNEVDGHAQFMQGVQPIFGWHGQFGFRRNTPPLRNNPSCFGTDVRSPTH
ncbi:sperm microtubule associated protein 1-like [Saccoglossus kowalevskii]|uniref:Uncharacterized protein C17orf98-like n=1 Tax=Saccoglossus kowalevskii TaxID=10224 RepID=A0ABM0GZ89_SACKO|nr:PREDICTED: uncharacterized protein C17orf98-like [Saccoglossus kowalevskii]